MNEFIKEIEEMTLEQVEERINRWEYEVRNASTSEELEGKEEQIEALKERREFLKGIEERKNAALELAEGADSDRIIERKGNNEMTQIEERAKKFAETGKFESRAVLKGVIAKPATASGVNGMAEPASDIVDDVHAVALNGTGAWVVGYKKGNAAAADVTDGSAVGGTASTYDYVTINPGEWGVLDQVSNMVKKLTPVDYMNAVENSAIIALRAKASDKIVAAVKASSIVKKKLSVALDADYLKNIVLGFRAEKTKGAVVLYLAQADLLTLGKVRGTNEKKALYEIEFDEGSTTSGTIKEGGLAVRFRVIDSLSTGEQLFGQPGAIDMPMWGGYEVATDEGGKFFENNQIGVRGLQVAGADLVVYHGMHHIKQAAA